MLLYLQKVYQTQKRQYHFLLIILTILLSFEFSFLAMYDAFSYFDFDPYEQLAMNTIPALPAFIAVILSIFATKYFISSRKQEFSILLLLGRNPKDLFQYLMIQFGILTGLSYFISIPFGTGIIAFINMLIDYVSYPFQLNYEFTRICFYHFWFVFVILIIILAFGAHQFVRLDIDVAKNMSTKYTMNPPAYQIKMSAMTQKKKIPIFSIITTFIMIAIFISSIVSLLDPNISTLELVFSFTYALAGEVLIVNTVIPLIYDLFHNSFLLKHPLLLNALADFNDYSKTMGTLMNLNACIVPVMLFLLFFSTFRYLTMVVVVACFIMTITMICLCFILRFSIYNENQKTMISTFHALGYSQKRLTQISLMKNSLFFVLAIIIPFLFLGELLWKATHEGFMTQNVALIIVMSYTCIYIAMMIYTFFKERQMQKEVSENVKYSHRSQ